MNYYLDSEFWCDKTVVVDVRKTPTMTIIESISQKPQFTPGCIDDLWYKGKIVVKDYPQESNKVCAHCLKDWGDGVYTLYPYREGIPFVLTPAEEINE